MPNPSRNGMSSTHWCSHEEACLRAERRTTQMVEHLDSALRSYGLVPPRADRCTYVCYRKQLPKSTLWILFPATTPRTDKLMELYPFMLMIFLWPVMMCLRRRSWDDFVKISKLVSKIRMIAFSWDNASNGSMTTSTVGTSIQNVAIDVLQELTFDKNWKDDTPLTPQTHTTNRSVLGQINWLQSRTQFHIGYQFSRCASKAASPTIENVCRVRAINSPNHQEHTD